MTKDNDRVLSEVGGVEVLLMALSDNEPTPSRLSLLALVEVSELPEQSVE